MRALRRNVAEEDVVIQDGGSPAKIECHAKIRRKAPAAPAKHKRVLEKDKRDTGSAGGKHVI